MPRGKFFGFAASRRGVAGQAMEHSCPNGGGSASRFEMVPRPAHLPYTGFFQEQSPWGLVIITLFHYPERIENIYSFNTRHTVLS